jgi:hypothetical protein
MKNENVEDKFNRCVDSTSSEERFLLADDCSLSKEGPYSRAEAISIFEQYHAKTHPLYILYHSNSYFVFY